MKNRQLGLLEGAMKPKKVGIEKTDDRQSHDESGIQGLFREIAREVFAIADEENKRRRLDKSERIVETILALSRILSEREDKIQAEYEAIFKKWAREFKDDVKRILGETYVEKAQPIVRKERGLAKTYSGQQAIKRKKYLESEKYIEEKIKPKEEQDEKIRQNFKEWKANKAWRTKNQYAIKHHKEEGKSIRTINTILKDV